MLFAFSVLHQFSTAAPVAGKRMNPAIAVNAILRFHRRDSSSLARSIASTHPMPGSSQAVLTASRSPAQLCLLMRVLATCRCVTAASAASVAHGFCRHLAGDYSLKRETKAVSDCSQGSEWRAYHWSRDCAVPAGSGSPSLPVMRSPMWLEV